MVVIDILKLLKLYVVFGQYKQLSQLFVAIVCDFGNYLNESGKLV